MDGTEGGGGRPDVDLSRLRRIAVYSQDGFGMGHLRRTNSIAAALLAGRADTTVLSICDSPSDTFFKPNGRHDRLKLPTVVKRGPGEWEATGLGLAFDAVRRLRSGVLDSALAAYEPDLLLVDHMPHGSMGELVPALERLRAVSPGLRVVLGLRDIVDAPEVVRQRWAVEGAFDALERFYDHVMIFGSPDLYDAARLYGFPDGIRARTSYCGYVVAPQDPPEQEVAAARRLFLKSDDARARLVLVMGGSGHDAAPMMAAAARSAALLRAGRPVTMVIVCGPNMPREQRHRLDHAGRSGGATVVRAVSDPAAVLRAADVVVAMAGYNSTVEILASGTPAVLVPRRGPSLEQRTRAGLFAERGWVRAVDPDALTPQTLAAAIDDALDDGRRSAPPGLDLAGLDAVTARLSLLLDGIDPSSPGLVLGGADGPS